jgi:flagellar biosynthesis protein FlhF
MEVKTFRASTLQDALRKVREELGTGAAVLQTREAPLSRLLGWLPGMRSIEVTASVDIHVPSRFAEPLVARSAAETPTADFIAPAKAAAPNDMAEQLAALQSMVADLCRRTRGTGQTDLPEACFQLYASLIDAEVNDDLARALVERTRAELTNDEVQDPAALRARLMTVIERDIAVAGPIDARTGRCRVVALVGPTGVGKTTTIAKLAANFRLRDKRKIGLITVDTYRVAAVEQLRTYAEIIDLPMEIVSTPREMREAVAAMSHLDLVLIDTAGRSPQDEIKIRELRALLNEANADEVHLVLASVASAASLVNTAQRFSPAGVTALILTKLDEATSLGNLLPLVRASHLKLSYLTNGQNVPDDIQPADAHWLAESILGVATNV